MTRRRRDAVTRRRFFHRVAASPCLLVLVFALTACASVTIPRADDPPTPAPIAATVVAPTARALTPTPSPTPDIPAGGTLTLGIVGSATLELNVMPNVVQEIVFDSLLRANAKTGALEPALAVTHTVSSDATTFTFQLRENVQWHNGDALIAEDVIATINAFASANFRGTPVTDFGTGMRVAALDTRTVQITFTEGYCPALTSLGTLPILPRTIARATNFPRLTPTQMIGTGAFKFRSLKTSDLVLERNADFWREPPRLDGITVRVFGDAATMRAAFNDKQIDLMPAASTEFNAIKNIPDAQRLAVDSNEGILLLFNLETAGLNDARVRQALNYALDRNVLLSDVNGQARALDALVLPGFWAQTATLPRYAFDVARAKQMLNEAGWIIGSDGLARKAGKPLRLTLVTQADHPLLEPLAFRVREQLAAVGIQAVLQLNDRNGLLTRMFEHQFELALVARKIPLDPDQHWYWQANQNEKGNGLNIGSYASAPVDALFKNALRVPGCEANARATVTQEINRALIADAPSAFLLAPKRYWVTRARVLGLAPSPFAGDVWNSEQWGAR